MYISPNVTYRPLTQDSAFSWFGYYDKLQVDPTGRFALCMKTTFEGRSPKPDDILEIGMVDMQNHDEWITLGTTTAWCWQQGCMLQWIPGSTEWVIWNQRSGDHFVANLRNVMTDEEIKHPHPIYTLAPDGKTALTTDFRRINDTRPGYGYCGIVDPWADELAPEQSGIWKIDLETGESSLILSIADALRVGKIKTPTKQWFNHLLVNPDASRFTWLHRWLAVDEGRGAFETRMLTANLDGAEIRTIDTSGHMSHFYWKDAHHLLGYTKPEGQDFHFYLIDERDGSLKVELDDPRNGHCLYLPGEHIILNDTYPQGPERLQELYLYDTHTGKREILGQFPAPKAYTGEWRCDLHARISPCGTFILFDSAHNCGRKLYRMDIGEAVENLLS